MLFKYHIGIFTEEFRVKWKYCLYNCACDSKIKKIIMFSKFSKFNLDFYPKNDNNILNQEVMSAFNLIPF